MRLSATSNGHVSALKLRKLFRTLKHMIFPFCVHDKKVAVPDFLDCHFITRRRLRESVADALSTCWNFPGKHPPTNNTVVLIPHGHHGHGFTKLLILYNTQNFQTGLSVQFFPSPTDSLLQE